MAERGRPRSFDRTEALDRAMRVFWAKTYEGASLTDLTRSMGINAPSLYAAFGSKERLFVEAVAHYAQAHGSEIWRALDENLTIEEAVRQFLLLSAASFSRPDVPPGCLIVLGTQHDAGDANVAHRELRARRRANLVRIAARFQRAIADGELPPDFDFKGEAALLLSIQTGMSVLARDGADRATLEAIASTALRRWSSNG